ncbi:MAG TPA: DUF799 family lipoprotein, partial [Syntrophorhabdaceae bacterium]|nr:DUF799 family lipoprotein [Syntrophorhabdaceae bacterium]
MMIFATLAYSEISKADAPDISIDKSTLPRVIAIMPFQNETEEKGLAEKIRKAFYNHFSSKPYTDIELSVIDAKSVQLEKSSGKSVVQLHPKEVCDAIGCDGIIYGKVTDFKKVFAIVYSQLSAEAEVWMVNAKTGKEVLRIKEDATFHGGGVPMSPLGAVMTAISTAMNLRDIQQVRMINELSHKLNEKIPSPEGIMSEERPIIKEVLTNVNEGPFGKGKTIRTGMEGDKGLVATFSIGNFRKGIPMKEAKPGIYTGEYLVLPGDNTRDMPVIVSLKKPGGYETEWIDVGGVVTIDTIPPPKVEGLKARGFQDRVDISWTSLKNVPDLKGYVVMRSEQPLSGYDRIVNTEQVVFEDKAVEMGKMYYYRVIAVDQTGNESDPQEAVRASLVGKEPVLLEGEIKKDTILSGLYIVEDEFVVPRGLVLTIESGTRIIFNKSASINVNGKLIINGKENPVEFLPSGDEQWGGVNFTNGNVLVTGLRIKGAETGLALKDTEGTVDGAFISESIKGISITGSPSPVIKNSSISRNETGIELIRSDAAIIGNDVFQNKVGISIKDFSGQIKDNNLIDNATNASSEATLKVAANFFGSVHVEEMRLKNINVVKVYDQRLPEGKIVDAIMNPYANMAHEDRQKKLA